jgi:hypothetical protein
VAAVRFAVIRTRKWGKKLSEREISRQPPVEGVLDCYTLNDEHLHRPVRIAKLTTTHDARRPELIPSLYDADVIALGATGATIIGVERLNTDTGLQEVAQSWWVRFVCDGHV